MLSDQLHDRLVHSSTLSVASCLDVSTSVGSAWGQSLFWHSRLELPDNAFFQMLCPSAYDLSHSRFNRKFNGSLKVFSDSHATWLRMQVLVQHAVKSISGTGGWNFQTMCPFSGCTLQYAICRTLVSTTGLMTHLSVLRLARHLAANARCFQRIVKSNSGTTTWNFPRQCVLPDVTLFNIQPITLPIQLQGQWSTHRFTDVHATWLRMQALEQHVV